MIDGDFYFDVPSASTFGKATRLTTTIYLFELKDSLRQYY